MAVRKTITVSITPEQDAFVRDRLKSGRFSSVSEVIRAGLRLLERDEARTSVAIAPADQAEADASLISQAQPDA